MFTQSRLNDLKKLAYTIEAKEEELATKLKKLPNSPQDGDIFLFKQGGELGLEWIVLFSHHKNDDLLLTIPADNNPMVGSTDITISEKALCGPLTLRCAQGVWIHKTDFQMSLRVGFLENRHWLRALNKTEQVFDGNLRSTVMQKENDTVPEYEEWMDLVSREQEILRYALHEQPSESVTLRLLSKIEQSLQNWTKRTQSVLDNAADDITLVPMPQAATFTLVSMPQSATLGTTSELKEETQSIWQIKENGIPVLELS
ncbi:MAG: hypothetical protein KAH77_01400, partial [Thiomargarita sp.]|nr:hypothetical protein [Thiomargarita sp.]